MPSLFIIGHLKTKGGAARQTVIDALTKVSEHSAANEPGVYKFCVALPREGDETSVFAIEEYADQSAMDKHMACQPVAELLKIFSTEPTLFSDAPAIYGLPNKLSPSVSFTRPSLAKLPDPLIIFANFGYKAGMAPQAVLGWKDVVAHAEKSEEGTLTYTVIADEEKSWIRTVEAYESVDFFAGHAYEELGDCGEPEAEWRHEDSGEGGL